MAANGTGSLASWVRDGVLFGALIPACGVAGFFCVELVREQAGLWPWTEHQAFAETAAWLAGSGAIAGFLVAPVAWAAAAAAPRLPPLATAGLGAVLGSVASVAAFTLFGTSGAENVVFEGSLGALIVTPLWLAYVGAGRRGRPGWVAALVAAPLSWVVGLAFALLVWSQDGWR